ncbi:CcdB family protein [Enterobacter sp. 118C5]|uniref:CcdB family protein n=1 Tax=Enterobacter TaxID=547 RepID=UPI00387E2369
MLIQEDCYDDLATRVIVPLARNNKLPLWQSHLAPGVNIDFETFLIYSPMITHLNNNKINPKTLFVIYAIHAMMLLQQSIAY